MTCGPGPANDAEAVGPVASPKKPSPSTSQSWLHSRPSGSHEEEVSWIGSPARGGAGVMSKVAVGRWAASAGPGNAAIAIKAAPQMARGLISAGNPGILSGVTNV